MDNALIAGVVAGIVSVLVAIINNQYNKPKVKSESDLLFAQSIRQVLDGSGDNAEMALKLAEALNERLKEQEQEYKRQNELRDREYARQIGVLQAKVDELKNEILYMLQVLKEHDIDYKPKPGLIDTGEKFKAAK